MDSQPAKVSNRISSLILFAAVAMAPLPFGSTSPIAQAVWCVVLGAGLVMASPGTLRRNQLTPLAAVAAIVASCLAVLAVQLAGVSWFGAGPAWNEASKLLGNTLSPSVSAVRNEPLFALGAPLASVLAFATSYIVCTDRRRSHQLLEVIAWSGVAYAVVGTVLFLTDPAMLLWREKTDYLSSMTGTFVNRNTAGVYFGSCTIVCLLLFLNRLGSHRSDRKPQFGDLWSVFGRSGSGGALWPLAVSFSRVVVLVSAMFMTKSRAGVVFSLLGLVVAFVVFRGRDFKRRRNVWISLAVAAAVALMALQFLGGAVGNRFDLSGLGDTARLDTYRSTLRMIGEHAWLGTGLGSFTWTFPAYRGGDSIWGTWNRAHNTLLEIGAETGLALMALTALAWGLIIAMLIHGIRVRRRDLFLPVAALSVAVVSIAHSLIDFSLQIPGYAIVVFALLGAGVAQSYSSHNQSTGLR